MFPKQLLERNLPLEQLNLEKRFALLVAVISIELRKTYYLNVFRGSTIRKINHFVAPTLAEEKLGVIIIHVGCNDVTKQNMNTVNPGKLVDSIINIGKLCASCGVTVIIMSSILPKRSIELIK